MQGDRYVRQMMMATTAVEILRREPSHLSDPRLRDRLKSNYAGVQGEFYACDPDLFAATYEEVAE